MSLFNFEQEKVQAELDDAARSALPEGKYIGAIKKAEVKKSKAGQEYVSFEIVLDNKRHLFDGLHLMHPNAAAIARQKLTRLLMYGYAEVPATLETMRDVCMALDGLPVHVSVKHGETNEKGYMSYKIAYLPLTLEQSKISFTPAASEQPF